MKIRIPQATRLGYLEVPVGGVVLDNCMGSGTTAVACVKEKRHFIGFELNEKYHRIACERAKREQQQLTLF